MDDSLRAGPRNLWARSKKQYVVGLVRSLDLTKLIREHLPCRLEEVFTKLRPNYYLIFGGWKHVLHPLPFKAGSGQSNGHITLARS